MFQIDAATIINFGSLSVSVLIDFNALFYLNNNRLINTPVFKNPRRSTIYIVFAEEYFRSSNLNKTYAVIDGFLDLSPIPMRPRCLFIIPPEIIWSKVEVEKLLRYAWSKNFLDFTVLKISDSNKSIFIDYNPFTQTYNHQNLLNSSEIFTDKLKDVNKYPLTMPLFNFNPQLLFQVGSNNSIQIRGQSYET